MSRLICTHNTISGGRQHALFGLYLQTLPEGLLQVCQPQTLTSYKGSRPCTQGDTAQQGGWPNTMRTIMTQEREKSAHVIKCTVLDTWTRAATFTYEDTGTQGKPPADSFQLCRGHQGAGIYLPLKQMLPSQVVPRGELLSDGGPAHRIIIRRDRL